MDPIHENVSSDVTLLNAYGNPIKHYGDLDMLMQRNRLDQMGAIACFIA